MWAGVFAVWAFIADLWVSELGHGFIGLGQALGTGAMVRLVDLKRGNDSGRL